MISVVVVGSGNVATHLIQAFSQVDTICLKQVYTRNLDDLETFKITIPVTNSLDLLEEADVTIIAVSDDAISEVSSQIQNSFVVHTSGNTGMQQLRNSTRKGVFYPLQSFSKEKPVDFHHIPFCLEVENSKDMAMLEILANALGGSIYHISSDQRKNIHVAAVFANNFTNHMYQMAKDICDTHQIPFDILQPLIEETADKVKRLSPKDAQTGPAIRKDEKTIKNHLNLLDSSQKELYKHLTESIQKHGKKL
ncbi:Rossmann-like and DUF2520 domain-containing protein [Pseudotenacibaculum haliotis]|uniref:Rossmann-like and DUF2520 domain-containing protein n=1 Tax=Pseudotenacibaculum haliotis TaxID=1862138 RepID=A0ABW5LSQ5_9FLAO